MTALRRTACRRWTLLGVKKGCKGGGGFEMQGSLNGPNLTLFFTQT